MEKPMKDAVFQHLQEENQRLRRALEELAILNDIATAVNSTLALEMILDLTIQKCLKHFQVEQGAILLLEDQRQDKPFHTVVRRGDSTGQHLPYRLDDQLSGWMLQNRTPLLINDLKNDGRFQVGDYDIFPVHSLLCVPMILKGIMTGLLGVFNKKSPTGFTADDQRLLAIIASQSVQVIENARLAEKEKVLSHMQEELRLAYEIQNNLLPKEPPLLSGYDIAGKSVPAKEVGGDYFDFLAPEAERLAFCLGDVSGKGLPAALLMANLQAAVRGQTMAGTSLTDCLERANTLLFHNTSPEKFATLFFGCLDTASHTLHYCNAGHIHPFLIKTSGENRRLETGGMVLGCLDGIPFAEEETGLEKGDTLVVFSDGVSEAVNDAGEEFGESRLASLSAANSGLSAAALIENIFAAVGKHARNQPQMDDMTMVVVKRNA
jgi:sigma-B regulation protein RsbU (phosphoserine phosphatase)